MTYGDSSFVLRLLTNEVGSARAVVVFRRLGRPALAFGPLHEIEIRNGLRMKAFMEIRSRTVASKTELNRELSAWEGRLERFLERGTLVKVEVSWDKVVAAALRLSREQTLRLGTRSYDILHVAMAAELHCRDFITCDLRQAKLARIAGMKVTMVEVRSSEIESGAVGNTNEMSQSTIQASAGLSLRRRVVRRTSSSPSKPPQPARSGGTSCQSGNEIPP